MAPQSGLFVVVAPGWRFRLGGPQKTGFFGSSRDVLMSSRGSNERPLSRIRLIASKADFPPASLNCFPRLKQATPVEDPALRLQGGLPACCPSFLPKVEASDPCRGSGSSPPRRTSRLLPSRAPISNPCRGFGSSYPARPSLPQESSRRPQDAPRGPKRSPRRPKTPLGVDFWPIWGSNLASKSHLNVPATASEAKGRKP